jgi:hypothetical protein
MKKLLSLAFWIAPRTWLPLSRHGALASFTFPLGRHAHMVYNRLMRGLSKRKLLRLKVKRKELQFKREELEYISLCASEMSRLLGFTNIDEINARTGHPYISLKILLSLYRRIRTLVNYETKGKADFSNKR